MAAIVDTDVLNIILTSPKRTEGDRVFRSWVERRHGILVYALTDTYKRELQKSNDVMELMRRYRQGGHAKLIEHDVLLKAKERLLGNEFIRSNDLHVLALALAGNVLVLCSRDKKLGEDFRDRNVLPRLGRKSRALYPLDAESKKRRRFLNNRRCSDRQ